MVSYEDLNRISGIESAGFDSGRILAAESGFAGAAGVNYTPYYQLTDHLGSVRTVFTLSEGRVRIVAQNDYYPFGLRHASDVLSHGSSTDNRYLFNGKEDQVLGRLGLLDYGARMYDPLTGRWFNLDPLAEMYSGISPYAYCAGNPVKFVDPDGRMIGDFINGNGRLIGTDGLNDGKVYVLKTTQTSYGEGNSTVSGAGISKSSSNATTKFIKTNSGNSEAFVHNSIAYDNSVEIEGAEINREKMVSAVSQDTGTGGIATSNNKEYGGSISEGNVTVASPGQAANPKTDAAASIMLPSGVSTFHSHPSGNVVEGSGGNTIGGTTATYGFVQSPSPQDISTAGSQTHYVFGRGDNTVYIYNSNGVQATLPMNRFVLPKK